MPLLSPHRARRAAAAIVVVAIAATTVATFTAIRATTPRRRVPRGGGPLAGARSPAGALSPTPRSTTSAAPRDAAASLWISIENARGGTLGWTVQHPSTNGQMEGYADQVSAQVGDTVRLFATTTAPTWTATAYRMGWYGGVLARAVWRSGPQRGVRQPPATFTPGVNLVTTGWSPSLTVHITTDWPPGDYLFKLTSSTGSDSYVPLTVRDDTSSAPILIVNAVTTWQAYNTWGGADLYSLASVRGRPSSGGRADIVSFDRPYRLGDGAGDFLGNEEKLVKLVEMAGLDVTYTTDVDLAVHPDLLLHHRVVVSLGHDEYYSTGMRAALEAARDHGVNLIFLGANAVYRHIRLQPSALGANREEVNYRSAGVDPYRKVAPTEVTVQWRDPPVRRPESTLLGEMYQCNPVRADMVVTDATAWLWAGTGVVAGEHLRGLVGSEYDHWDPRQPQPAGSRVELIAQSPLSCRRRASTSDFTYYIAPSGAGVIDTGTNNWIPMTLDDPAVGAVVAHVTLTLLRAASGGPLGVAHPARRTPAFIPPAPTTSGA